MVKVNLRRTAYFLLCLLLIIFVCRLELVHTAWEKAGEALSAKRTWYSSELSAKEIQSFMRLWPEFNELKLSGDKNISYLAELPSQSVNWKAKVWFTYNQWDIDRFFYVQQRLIYLLQAVEIRRNALGIIAQLEGREDELAQQMIQLQEDRIRGQEMAFKELLIVSAKEKELKELFKQYP